MSVLSAINKAKEKKPVTSESARVWQSLTEEERGEIRDVLKSEIVGPGKLAELLADEGVQLGKYLLGKVKKGEV